MRQAHSGEFKTPNQCFATKWVSNKPSGHPGYHHTSSMRLQDVEASARSSTRALSFNHKPSGVGISVIGKPSTTKVPTSDIRSSRLDQLVPTHTSVCLDNGGIMLYVLQATLCFCFIRHATGQHLPRLVQYFGPPQWQHSDHSFLGWKTTRTILRPVRQTCLDPCLHWSDPSNPI